MNKSTHLSFILAAILVSAGLTGCGAPSLLIKPAADHVKKVALVNVYANRGVRSFSGQSKIGGLTALASMATGKEGKKEGEADFGGTRLPSYASTVFNEEFSKINGWQVVRTEEVLQSPHYSQFIDDIKGMSGNATMAKLSELSYITPDKMSYIPSGGRAQDGKRLLTKLAQDLGVDAVAVLELDVAYTPNTAIGGTGTAAAYVGTSLVVVNRFGDYVVSMPKVISEKGPNSYRIRSDETTGMVAGEILYSSGAEKIFQESIRKGITAIRDKISEEINGKKKS